MKDKNQIDLIHHFLVEHDIPFTYKHGKIAILELFDPDLLRKFSVNYDIWFDGNNLFIERRK